MVVTMDLKEAGNKEEVDAAASTVAQLASEISFALVHKGQDRHFRLVPAEDRGKRVWTAEKWRRQRLTGQRRLGIDEPDDPQSMLRVILQSVCQRQSNLVGTDDNCASSRQAQRPQASHRRVSDRADEHHTDRKKNRAAQQTEVSDSSPAQ